MAKHKRVGPIRRFIGRTALRVFHWELHGEIGDVRKAVFIASPHTSNWDGYFMVATAYAMGIKLSWMGKESLFKGPFGPITRFLGGIPVNRSGGLDTVNQIAKAFAEHDDMLLAIAPAGTRKQREFWKSGFYHIASAADVPFVCAFVDFERRTSGIGPIFKPTGDMKADMDRLRTFYQDIRGRHPDCETGVQLRNETSEE